VIDHGRVIAEGKPDELKSRVGGERLEVTLETYDDEAAAVEALAPLADERPKCEHGILVMPLHRGTGGIAEAVRRLDAANVGIADIAVRRPTLDDVFMVLTGHTAEEAEAAEEEAAA
jgi:ABC-2 type transport system ATP-binding protein